MQASPKRWDAVVPIRPRPPVSRPACMPAASSSTVAVQPPLREILPAPSTAATATNQQTLDSKSSKHTKIVIVANLAESKRSPSIKPPSAISPIAALPAEESMIVRRAAASSARLAVQKAAQFDNSDDGSDIDDSDSDGDLTPITGTRESTMEPKPVAPSKALQPGKGKTVSKSMPLDMSTVRTSAPAIMPPRKTERLFGLEHCPIYYPSDAEFAQPLEYIERIAKQTRDHQYGICKVVPPKGWQPPFSLNTETFRFATRMQQLNSMEATARANLNFVEQLTIFHRQQKHSEVTIPIVMKQPLDLWRLRKEVNALGGFDSVCHQRRWSQIGRTMGFDPDRDHALTKVLRTAYSSIIQPFEQYKARVKTTLTPEGQKPTSLSNGMRTKSSNATAQTNMVSSKVSLGASVPVTAEQVQAASAKLNEALSASPGWSSTPGVVSKEMGSAFVPREEMEAGDFCEVCKSDDDAPTMLLCDDCDKGYHLACLSPPLKEVPKGDWICDACIVNRGDDYGFEEGDEHTLSTFQYRAQKFRKEWLASHPVPGLAEQVQNKDLSGAKEHENWERELLFEDHVEREFWRLVASPDEAVEVEYGADIHTTKWGSAVPTLESDKSHPYARDGWNLTNLPILPGSVLRYVKSDICGMTVPWAYVGMMFSTFAWHKEDHNTYSVNYHHLGGTKTWYGVPGEDDEKLEAAMQAAAPELFEAQPDLMYQLVTLMSPGRLKEAGVRVSACDQRPNEFVITFPKAYHAGFNHDFNYNEAVNFCLPDWLTFGLEGVRKYKTISKPPVFSHDELLITIYSYEKTPKASQWLLPLFREMVTRELADRARAKANIPDLELIVEDEQQEDDQYQCVVDKSFCYLSQIVTKGHSEVACTDHSSTLPAGGKIMKIRFTDEDLLAMLKRVHQRASATGANNDAEAVKRKAVADAVESSLAAKKARPAFSGPINRLMQVAEQTTTPANLGHTLRAM